MEKYATWHGLFLGMHEVKMRKWVQGNRLLDVEKRAIM